MKKLIPMLLLWSSALAALAQGVVVVPNGFGNVEGNSSTSDPFTSSSFRFQQVFSASQFGTTPFFINNIRFRMDGASSGDVLYSFGGGTVQFSTTTRTADNLSSVFADNIGSDVTTVRNGAFSFGGTFQPGASPQPFGQTISVSPFLYNPAQGNLLLDIRGRSGLVLFPGALDAESTVGDSVSWVFASSELPTFGNVSTLGLITRFDVALVPEPSTWMITTMGLSILLALKRRRS